MKSDREWMTTCLELAKRVLALGRPPITAIIVGPDGIIGQGTSGYGADGTQSFDLLDHAEVLALRQAEEHGLELSGATLFTTLEPCLMCLGAAAILQIQRIVFAYPAIPDGAKWVSDASWATVHDTGLVEIPTVSGPTDVGVMQSLFVDFLRQTPSHKAAQYVRKIVNVERPIGRPARGISAFDAYYEENEWTFGSAPTDLVKRFEEMLSRQSKVLELGCGDGRDAFYIAEKGHSVMALDVSTAAIRKISTRLAKAPSLRIEAIVFDIARVELLASKFDAIVGITALDHLEEGDIQHVLSVLHNLLNESGRIAFQVHTRDDPGFLEQLGASETASWVRHYFRSDELWRRLSRHYEIEYYNEWDEVDLDHGPAHKHNFAAAIARRKL